MLKQNLNHKIQQKLSPNQIQLMKLVQLPILDFEDRVIKELEENPALESNDNEIEEENPDIPLLENEKNKITDVSNINVDNYLNNEVPYYKIYGSKNIINNYFTPVISNVSFYEYLKSQLRIFNLSNDDFEIANFILGNLDKNGYLQIDFNTILNDIEINLGVVITIKKLEFILKNYIQKLDPIGVGSRNLQECLCLQLKNKKNTYLVKIAYNIIKYNFKSFYKKHYYKIQENLKINKSDLRKVIKLISKLYPKPGINYYNEEDNFDKIIPDFNIYIYDDKLELTLNNKNIPNLKISSNYINIFDSYKYSKNKTKDQKRAVLFIKNKLDSAKWFIEALNQREKTLMLTMDAIMNYQKDYFLSGDEEKIKPMILKDIANIVKLDISTVSRVASRKYVSTPYGTFLIKKLFSEGLINNRGIEVSSIEIKRNLLNFILKEDKKNPFTDHKLSNLLISKGYNLARRTVAKYREQLNIPVSRLRKSF